MFDIFSAIKMVASPITDIVKGWQARKTVKLKSEIAISGAKTTAQIKKIETGQLADIAWEKTSLEQSGWKDEWFVILLSIPMILCFIPGGSQYVERGFAALDKTPVWYQWAIMVAIGSSFGYKKFCDFMSFKKGS